MERWNGYLNGQQVCTFPSRHSADAWLERHRNGSVSPEVASVTTEDGATIAVGSRAFNYYDMKVGTIGRDVDDHGWFTFSHDDGTSVLLDGSRVCSLRFASTRGWIKGGAA